MKRILIAVGVLIVVAALLRVSGVTDAQRRETEVAWAFACGYRFGQVSIMSRMPTAFPPGSPTLKPPHCPDIKALAIKHGFKEAE